MDTSQKIFRFEGTGNSFKNQSSSLVLPRNTAFLHKQLWKILAFMLFVYILNFFKGVISLWVSSTSRKHEHENGN